MADLRLLAKAAKGSGSIRNRVLVLLSALVDWPVERLRQVTLGEVLHEVRRGNATPLGGLLRDLLVKLRKSGVAMDAPVFASRKGTGAIGRIQAWRIITKALGALGVEGAFKVLRHLFELFRLPSVVVESLKGLDVDALFAGAVAPEDIDVDALFAGVSSG